MMEDTLLDSWEGKRAALIIAHPGHELRIHHWLERARPLVFVLTDGSGNTKSSRIDSTTEIVKKAGALIGSVYGRFSDKQIYAGILTQNVGMFSAIADEIAEILNREGVEYVVGDAVEGVNPTHDLCRLIANSALMRLKKTTQAWPENFEFPVEGPPNDCPPEDLPKAIQLNLSDEAFQRKVDAVRGYAELAVDVDRILASNARDAFRFECLRPVDYDLEVGHRFQHPCIYEVYGAKQVAAGYYKDVIRFRDHMAPLARALAP